MKSSLRDGFALRPPRADAAENSSTPREGAGRGAQGAGGRARAERACGRGMRARARGWTWTGRQRGDGRGGKAGCAARIQRAGMNPTLVDKIYGFFRIGARKPLLWTEFPFPCSLRTKFSFPYKREKAPPPFSHVKKSWTVNRARQSERKRKFCPEIRFSHARQTRQANPPLKRRSSMNGRASGSGSPEAARRGQARRGSKKHRGSCMLGGRPELRHPGRRADRNSGIAGLGRPDPRPRRESGHPGRAFKLGRIRAKPCAA